MEEHAQDLEQEQNILDALAIELSEEHAPALMKQEGNARETPLSIPTVQEP